LHFYLCSGKSEENNNKKKSGNKEDVQRYLNIMAFALIFVLNSGIDAKLSKELKKMESNILSGLDQKLEKFCILIF
jgi:hypothetical protein